MLNRSSVTAVALALLVAAVVVSQTLAQSVLPGIPDAPLPPPAAQPGGAAAVPASAPPQAGAPTPAPQPSARPGQAPLPASSPPEAPAATPAQPAPAQSTTPPAATTPAASPPATLSPTQPTAAPPAAVPARPPAVDTAGLPAELGRRLDRIGPELARLQKAVERVRGDDGQLTAQRGEVETFRREAEDLKARLRDPLAAVDDQLRRLGPKPKETDPPEAAAIAAERSRLEALRGRLDGGIKSLDLADERARQLIGRIQTLRHGIMSGDILRLSPSPLLPALWEEVGLALPRAVHQIVTILSTWSDLLMSKPLVSGLIFTAAAVAGLWLSAVRDKFLTVWLPEPPVPAPSYLRRVAMATRASALRVLPGLTMAVILFGGLELAGLLNVLVRPLFTSALIGVVIYCVIMGLGRAIFMPRHPSWRLVTVTNSVARRLMRLIAAVAVVLALDLVLDATIRALYMPLSVGVVKTHIANTALALLMGAVVVTPNASRRAHADSEATARDDLLRRWLQYATIPVLAIATAIVIASSIGYVGAASFVSRQVLLLATVAIAVLLLHLSLRGSLHSGTAETASPRSGLLTPARQRQVIFLVELLANAILISGVVVAMLLSWGFAWVDIAGYLRAFVFGFDIGGVRISLARIIIAIGLFLGLLFVTRLVQRWLSISVLSPERMDAGIANSIETGIGYGGAILAGLIGLSYAGLDITNLAIVAGALSVGIGFGLQSIVNNFVSGLILLVERPIKVGDWIVVGEHQGFVRRISVRATEIETFDRASVVVPNSSLISGAVQNWTLRNAMGRLTIKVGASYSADPEHVLAVLKDAVSTCQSVLKYPPPKITFTDFGASSLDFTVHAFVAEVTKGLDAQTEIRIAISRKFREAGIEIPFPQTDVHMRDLDAVKLLVARLAEERARSAADGRQRDTNAADAETIPDQPKPAGA